MISTGGQPNQYADWPSGIPDPATKGPDWILIGTEGGAVPKPVVVPQQPIGWNLNPTTFNFGNVNQHSLLLGSAERADVIVDFTAYAGQTLILYNDAPAAFPAGVPTYDYYTGVANQMDAGGAPTTLPGYGPNTRTIMQIRVGPTVRHRPTARQPCEPPGRRWRRPPRSAASSRSPRTRSSFRRRPTTPPTTPRSPRRRRPVRPDRRHRRRPSSPSTRPERCSRAVTLPLEMKAMHDEMGGVYDTLFGRMSGMLGLSNPLSPVHTLIPYGYSSPPTDLVKGSLEATPIGVMPDGTQLWRIFHNGVDTHTIHTHLFHAQLDQPPRPGRSPAAGRPDRAGLEGHVPGEPAGDHLPRVEADRSDAGTAPVRGARQHPPDRPDAARGGHADPAAARGWFDPAGNQIDEILNHYVNFGWEYVWHCHILAHEEMDMMHSLVFAVPPKAPTGLDCTVAGNTRDPEAGWTTPRKRQGSPSKGRRMPPSRWDCDVHRTVGPNVQTFNNTVATNTKYWYRVFAIGPTVGDWQTAGFPTMSADSVSNTISVTVGTPPSAVPANPTLLTATVQAGPRVRLVWRDNATNETGFVIERCTVVAPATTCTNFAQIATTGPRNGTGNVPAYLDTTVTVGNTYFYQVWAVNAVGRSLNPTQRRHPRSCRRFRRCLPVSPCRP